MNNFLKKVPIVTVISALTLVMGFVDIFSAISPAVPARLMLLRPVFPFLIRSTVRLGTALIGLSLIVLSRGLARRKQAAWGISVFFLCASFLFHLIKGLDIEEAFVTLGLLFVLIRERKKFTARPDVPSIVQGLRALVLAFVFTLFYGTVGLFIFERGIRGAFTIQRAFSIVFNSFFLIAPAPVFRNPIIGVFFGSIFVIGFISIAFALIMILRPVILRYESSDYEREKVKRLFAKFGRNYVADIILLPGKYYFFNKNDQGFLAYKPVGGFAIVIGEPVCFPENRAENIKEFSDFCKEHGWVPVFAGVDKSFAEVTHVLGMKNVMVGHKAMINLMDYDFEGSKKKPLRYSISIMNRLGYTFEIVKPPISDDDTRGFRETSDYWLKNFKGEEMRFLVGYFDDKYIKENYVASVKDEKGTNVAFANFYEYGDGELAIDLMRHRDVPPDTMLYLFTNLVLWAKEKGYKKINLGMAVLYGLGGAGSKTEEKALKVVFERFNRLYNFKGLYVFKSKFQPEWVPVYFVYPSRLDLTGALVALIRAD